MYLYYSVLFHNSSIILIAYSHHSLFFCISMGNLVCLAVFIQIWGSGRGVCTGSGCFGRMGWSMGPAICHCLLLVSNQYHIGKTFNHFQVQNQVQID